MKKSFLLVVSLVFITSLQSIQKTNSLSVLFLQARVLFAKWIMPENLSNTNNLKKIEGERRKMLKSLTEPIKKYPPADSTGC